MSKLKFWFNQDPTLPLPLVCVWNYWKKHGLLPKDEMTYDEFAKMCEENDNIIPVVKSKEK